VHPIAANNFLTRDKTFYKEFFPLFFLLIIQNALLFSVNFADNIMLGDYNVASMTGVAVVNQVHFIYQQILAGAGEAMVVLGSQYHGQNRREPIKKLLPLTLVINYSTGLLFFILASFFPASVLGIFTKDPDIIAEGVKYFSILKFTYLFFPMTMALYYIFRSIQAVKVSFYMSIFTLVANCSLNYILIYGRFGAPELGVTGAAIGTVAVRFMEFAAVAFIFFVKDKDLRLKLKDLFTFDRNMAKDYFRQARYFVVVAAIFGASTAIHTAILGNMQSGENVNIIAANSAASTLFQFFKVIAIGSAAASAVIIGKTVGRGDIGKVKEYARTLQIIFLCIGVFTSVMLLTLRLPVLGLYGDFSPETLELAKSLTLVFCVTCIGTAYQMPVLAGIVRGGGDSRFIFYNDLISIWCIMLPFSFLAAFIFRWPPVAVVFCLNSDQLFKCGAAFIKCNKYRWIKKLTR